MSTRSLNTLDVESRQAWREWLQEHHRTECEIWLVFHKRHTTRESISYNDSVEEALCFGWIDSLVRRLDEDRYARKFTPRKPNSAWSTSNRQRYADLQARGLLAPAGLERPPTERSGDGPRSSVTDVLPYIEEHLRANPPAWEQFKKLAPSHRRAYLAWIDSAKREETKARRLSKAVEMLAAGRKPGIE